MWSIQEKVFCAHKKKMYSAFGWNILKISIRPICSNVSFKAYVFLLIFYFDYLPIDISGVLNFPTFFVLLSISPFMSFSVSLMCCSSLGCVNIYSCHAFFLDWAFDHVVSFIISFNILCFRSFLSDMRMATSAFLEYNFHSLTFSLYMSLGQKWVFCRQCTYYESCFYIHSASMCLGCSL